MLYLLPNLLGELADLPEAFPPAVAEAVSQLDGLIAEDEKEARIYLKRFTIKKPLQQMPIALLNEHTPAAHLKDLLLPLEKGETWGIISDAGLPCLADPGSGLVLLARTKQIPIKAFVGPSSIVLALMLSGLSGQSFSFRGYIPKEPHIKIETLQRLERESKKEHSTQIFMDAPYRTDATFQLCLEKLQDHTLFCVACDLTLPTQFVETLPIKQWKKNPLPAFGKRPALFLIGSVP